MPSRRLRTTTTPIQEPTINEQLADVVPLKPREEPARVSFRYTNQKMADDRFHRLLTILFTDHSEEPEEQAA
ncbi:hypothetical protein [Streptomyces sp. BH105]|uniref:hypothetical protein n=1 Tax=Streptomyces sp. BH105 TaxID=3410408 RepID=UPI003CEC1432